MWSIDDYCPDKKTESYPKEAPPEQETSVFSNMFSLLHPPSDENKWPVSLELPDPMKPNLSEEVKLPTIFSFSSTLMPEECELVFGDLSKRKCREVTACPHTGRKHYAKNMCNNCYHRQGREKQAWVCPHSDRPHYAKGKCQFCYLQQYHKSRVFGKRRCKKKRC